MENIGGILMLILIVFGFYFLFIRVKPKIPSFDKYIQDFPDCNSGSGIKCNKCGSKSIRNWGVRSKSDALRYHICNHCGTELYYSKR